MKVFNRGSIFLFNYHDFQGLYVLTEINRERMTFDFEAILTTPNCDSEINLTWQQAMLYGSLIYESPDLLEEEK